MALLCSSGYAGGGLLWAMVWLAGLSAAGASLQATLPRRIPFALHPKMHTAPVAARLCTAVANSPD